MRICLKYIHHPHPPTLVVVNNYVTTGVVNVEAKINACNRHTILLGTLVITPGPFPYILDNGKAKYVQLLVNTPSYAPSSCNTIHIADTYRTGSKQYK